MNGMELCAGIGALGLGVSRAIPEYRTVVAAEIEAFAVAVLAARQQDGSLPPFPIWDDLTTFDGSAWRGVVDIVVAGFPCTDISLAGKGAGIYGERSGLWFDVLRTIRDVGPSFVFLENVSAITLRGMDVVLAGLAECGFSAEFGCLRASDVGAPHGRNRWWCLAWDRGLVADDGNRDVEHVRGIGRHAPDQDGPSWTHEGERRIHARESGQQLADSANGRRRTWLTDADAWRGQPNGARGHALVGDPAGIGLEVGRGIRRDVCEERSPTGGAGNAVADPEGCTVDSVPVLREFSLHDPRDARSRLCVPVNRGVGERSIFPGFPPGPGDRDGWRAFLSAYPDLAPAIESQVRSRADGPASAMDVCLCPRVDQLRALGNAVVPAQCEAALRILWKRAFNEDL